MKRENLATGGAVLAAIGASVCCIGPLLFVALGLGTFGAANVFEPARPYLLGLALLALAFGFYRAYFQREACAPDGACATKPVGRFARLSLWLASAAVLVLALSPYYVGTLARHVGTAAPDAQPPAAAQQPATTRSSLKVRGMTCAGCETTIKLALERTPGVHSAEVSYDRGEAVVEYDAKTVTVDKLCDAINQTGYACEQPQ